MSEKWWDMSDDELDDLFREASDKVDVPFESSSFDKLRQKIDIQRKPEPAQGYKKRWLVLLAGLFLMVGVGLVYRFGNDLKDNNSMENAVKPLNSPSSSKTIPQLSVSSQMKNSNLKQSPVRTAGTHSQITTEGNELEKSPVRTAGTHSQTTTEGNELEKSPVRTTGTDSQTTEITTKDNNLERSSVVTTGIYSQIKKGNIYSYNTSEKIVEDKSITSIINDSKTYSIEQDKVIENINFNSYNTENKLVRFNNSKNNKDREGKIYPLNPQIIEQNVSPVFEDLTSVQDKIVLEETVIKTNFYNVDFLKNKDSKSLLTGIKTELPDYVDSLPRTIKPLKLSRFGVRLALSPDINATETVYSSPLGSSFGVLFEYRLSKKFIIQTGVTYSIKKYNSSFDDYHNFADTWKRFFTSKPTSVDGKCTIIDIPINLRMNVFQKNNQTWFLSTGVSTYIMPTEGASYNFSLGSPVAREWSDNTKYNWSTFNLSLGFEKQFTKHIYFQIEPYLKSPLAGIGRGGINLKSSGLLFSTKYEF
jgi:Outer membrane protein beta-barrel domain